jgi:lysophospholipase L1-like esterase
MKLDNLKINILGDSITEGRCASVPEKGYVGLLQERYPNATIRNYGVCGSCISNKCLWGVRSFIERADEMDEDADLVVVFGGTNDYCCCCPPGQWGDQTEDTFYGACWVLFDMLLRRYHGKTIAVMTPIHRLDEDGTICEERPMVAPLKCYVEILKETAEYFGFPVIDLFATSGLQPEIDYVREAYFPDGLHLNDDGHEILFRRIDGALQNLY